MDLRSNFIEWYFNEFRLDELYLDMDMTTEGSPWHRERTVGVHTDMVVSQYMTRTQIWNKSAVVGALAAAFHDVGKPPAEETVYSEERGEYRRYKGHEPMSARLWEDWAVRNFSTLKARFGFKAEDIYRVGFIIEHHLPWGLKDRNKRLNLMLTLIQLDIEEAFINHLLSDTTGRISDDAETKIRNALEWVDQFRMDLVGAHQHSSLYESAGDRPVMYVPIGASGSGKSTTYASMDDVETFSLDRMRLELYGEPYEDAFRKSTEDKHFRSACNDRYRDILRTNKDVFLDNTNTSKKTRRFYITEARNRGYRIVALLFPIQLQTLLDRQRTREDKTVPDEAVRRQYMGLSLPQYGEFDEVRVLSGNL